MIKDMVEKFQCPGCVAGSNTQCGIYKYDPDEMKCVSHVLGTQVGLGNHVAIGLPRGFNKPGWSRDRHITRNTIDVRLWTAGTKPDWNHLNVAVWALEKDGFLFVRTFAPRVNMSWVDVIEGGTFEMVPHGTISVAEFINDID